MKQRVSVSAVTWLDAWEAAAALAPGLREAELLRPACQSDAEALGRLPIGARDALLLDLRYALFGPRLQCIAACPACGELCEWSCGVDALRAEATAIGAETEGKWHDGGWDVRFRLLNGLDLAAANACADETAAAYLLRERCVIAATHEGVDVAARDFPDAVAEALGAAMAKADPQAASTVALSCPACGEPWEADFDIGAFVWTEFDAWARRALAEVHLLASHYGWSERDILTMSPARRAQYVAMVRS
jgi:hypothetical protein